MAKQIDSYMTLSLYLSLSLSLSIYTIIIFSKVYNFYKKEWLVVYIEIELQFH